MHFTIKKVNSLLADMGMNGRFGKGRGKYAGGYIYARNGKTTVVCNCAEARRLGSALEAVWKIRRELANA